MNQYFDHMFNKNIKSMNRNRLDTYFVVMEARQEMEESLATSAALLRSVSLDSMRFSTNVFIESIADSKMIIRAKSPNHLPPER